MFKPRHQQLRGLKADVAQLVEADPAAALEPNWRSPFDGLITALENKLRRL